MVLTEQEFLADVADHKVTILRDDGVYRHIRFQAPVTRTRYFDLLTWPGHLCYTGDMGTFIFSRLFDMFSFFRENRERSYRKNERIPINPGYWAQKLLGVDRYSGYEEFDPMEFTRVVSEYRKDWIKDRKLNKQERRELWDAVTDEVLHVADQGEHRALDAAYNFSYRVGGAKFQFNDLFDYRFTRYTNEFIWCCYAIVWGIGMYDTTTEITSTTCG